MAAIVGRKTDIVNRAFPGISGHSDKIDIWQKKKTKKKTRRGGRVEKGVERWI
jgi:hypothetical protein